MNDIAAHLEEKMNIKMPTVEDMIQLKRGQHPSCESNIETKAKDEAGIDEQISDLNKTINRDAKLVGDKKHSNGMTGQRPKGDRKSVV